MYLNNNNIAKIFFDTKVKNFNREHWFQLLLTTFTEISSPLLGNEEQPSTSSDWRYWEKVALGSTNLTVLISRNNLLVVSVQGPLQIAERRTEEAAVAQEGKWTSLPRIGIAEPSVAASPVPVDSPYVPSSWSTFAIVFSLLPWRIFAFPASLMAELELGLKEPVLFLVLELCCEWCQAFHWLEYLLWVVVVIYVK